MTEGAAPAETLDVISVVYARELKLLRLQARSIDRYLAPGRIGRVIVIVNDVSEDACAQAVEAIRPDYGRLAPRLEVIRPAALFALRPAALGPRGLRQRLRHGFTRNRRSYPFAIKGGWCGNRGWSVQQALKLLVARYGESAFQLLLDTKNHFIRPVSFESFVSGDSRAKSFLKDPNDKQRLWIEASFRRMGVPPPGAGQRAPPTVTPVCVRRAVLRDCLDALEQRVGPAEDFFARKRSRESEFMLLYADVVGRHGSWSETFASGLEPAATIHRRSDAQEIERVFSLVESGAANVLSLHIARLHTLEPGHRRRLEAIWAARGLLDRELLSDMGPAA